MRFLKIDPVWFITEITQINLGEKPAQGVVQSRQISLGEKQLKCRRVGCPGSCF